jgi:hypothetical protein
MQLTNRLNIPEPIVKAVEHDTYHQDGHISVTGLIQPPRIRQLTSRHREEISIDVADRIWPLLGSAIHSVLERAQVDNALQEERLAIDVNGWKVTGQPDLYFDHTVYDFKFTSVWSFMDGVRWEYEAQLNCYANLLSNYNFTVKGAAIVAIFRDWSKHAVKRSSNYPETQSVILPVELWDLFDSYQYILQRVTYHQDAESLPDNDLPICTPEERWERPTTYAVKKRGNKRAARVLPSMEEAEAWAMDNMKDKPFEIETRPGESVRCASYCDVAPFCNWWQAHKPEEG